jgi:hypothetical protein
MPAAFSLDPAASSSGGMIARTAPAAAPANTFAAVFLTFDLVLRLLRTAFRLRADVFAGEVFRRDLAFLPRVMLAIPSSSRDSGTQRACLARPEAADTDGHQATSTAARLL